MNTVKLSRRAKDTPPSPIRKLAGLAQAAKERGTKVYHLNIGQPDIRTPPEFFDGLDRAKCEVVAYERSQGNADLCRAWVEFINKQSNVSVSEQELIITTGASEAIIFAFMTCCDPEDEIIIFDPTYSNFIGFAAIAGIKLIPLHTRLGQNFSLPDKLTIEAALSGKTRAILVCNPNNPTGSAYTEAELRQLLLICEEHNLYLIVDETYREFVYDGRRPLSILEFAGDNQRVIVIDSLSKRYSLCGARIGCLITPNEELQAATLNLAQARLASPTLDQQAAAYMLRHISPAYIEQTRSEYERRRDCLCEALNQVPGISFNSPAGAFYLIAQLPVKNSEHFARFLLTDFAHNGTTTFVAPASGFYMETTRGDDKVRLAYVLNCSALKDAVEIIRLGLDRYHEFVESPPGRAS